MTRHNTSEIIGIIRAEIERGTYRLHDKLPPERHMAERFGVARNTLRTALSLLEKQGYVQVKRSSGTFVVYEPLNQTHDAVSDASPLELMDARFALEPHICRLCVMHGRREHFTVLEKLCDEMENAVNDPSAFSTADTDFHRMLAKSTGNGLLMNIIDQISSVRVTGAWTRMRHLTLTPQQITEYNQQHRMVLETIRNREPELAAQTMKDHLETARLSLTRAAST